MTKESVLIWVAPNKRLLLTKRDDNAFEVNVWSVNRAELKELFEAIADALRGCYAADPQPEQTLTPEEIAKAHAGPVQL